MEENNTCIYHLRRIGPRATLPDVANIMDFIRTVTLIGRSRLGDVDYIIDSKHRNRKLYISRLHARVIRQRNNTCKLVDDSFNGIFINNIKIADSVILREADLVTFGHPNGNNLPTGEKCRQPASEYQFIFERCTCTHDERNVSQTRSSTGVIHLQHNLQSGSVGESIPRYNTDVPATVGRRVDSNGNEFIPQAVDQEIMSSNNNNASSICPRNNSVTEVTPTTFDTNLLPGSDISYLNSDRNGNEMTHGTDVRESSSNIEPESIANTDDVNKNMVSSIPDVSATVTQTSVNNNYSREVTPITDENDAPFVTTEFKQCASTDVEVLYRMDGNTERYELENEQVGGPEVEFIIIDGEVQANIIDSNSDGRNEQENEDVSGPVLEWVGREVEVSENDGSENSSELQANKSDKTSGDERNEQEKVTNGSPVLEWVARDVEVPANGSDENHGELQANKSNENSNDERIEQESEQNGGPVPAVVIIDAESPVIGDDNSDDGRNEQENEQIKGSVQNTEAKEFVDNFMENIDMSQMFNEMEGDDNFKSEAVEGAIIPQTDPDVDSIGQVSSLSKENVQIPDDSRTKNSDVSSDKDRENHSLNEENEGLTADNGLTFENELDSSKNEENYASLDENADDIAVAEQLDDKYDESFVDTDESLDNESLNDSKEDEDIVILDDENDESFVDKDECLDNESLNDTKEDEDLVILDDENDESFVNTEEAFDDYENDESLVNTEEALDEDENIESFVNTKEAFDEDENDESIVKTEEAFDDGDDAENDESHVNTEEAFDDVGENDESLVNAEEDFDDDENEESLVNTEEALDDNKNDESTVNTKEALNDDENNESLGNTKEALDDDENDESIVNTKEALDDDENNESTVNTKEALDDDENNESLVKTKEALNDDENDESIVNAEEALNDDKNNESIVKTEEALDEDENNESIVNTKEAFDDVGENDESLVNAEEAFDEDENNESLLNTKEALDDEENHESLVNTKEALNDDENDESLVNTEEAFDEDANDESLVNTKEALDDEENNESIVNTKEALNDDENNEGIVNAEEALDDDENNESIVKTEEALDEDENNESIVKTEEALDEDENNKSIVNTKEALDGDENNESLVNTKKASNDDEKSIVNTETALDEDENNESIVNTKEALDEDENNESIVNTKEALDDDENNESIINTEKALDEDENNESIVNTKEALDEDENDESIVNTKEAFDEDENDESVVNTKEALNDDENNESIVNTKEALDEDENNESIVNTKEALDEDENDESIVNTKEAFDEDENDESVVNTKEALNDDENNESIVNTKEALDEDENNGSIVNTEEALDEEENYESLVNTKVALNDDENNESIENTKEVLDEDESNESLVNAKEALDDDENDESLVNTKEALDEDENIQSFVNTKEAFDEDENDESIVNTKEALDNDENDESTTKEAFDADEKEESLVNTEEALDEDKNYESTVNTKEALDDDENDESTVNTEEALDDDENDKSIVNTKEALDDDENNESTVNTKEALDDDENDKSIVNTKEALDDDENNESTVNTKEALDDDENNESIVKTEEALDEDENNESLVCTKEALNDDENNESIVNTKEALDEDENNESLVNTKETLNENENNETIVNAEKALDDENNESIVKTEEALDEDENNECLVNTKEALNDDENNESIVNAEEALDEDENDESIVNTKDALDEDENNESIVNTKEALDEDENNESIVNTKGALDEDENNESFVNTKEALNDDENNESLVNTKEAFDDENDGSLVNTKRALDDDENNESIVKTEEALDEDENNESIVNTKEALDDDENNESIVNAKEALSDDENNKSIVNTKEALDDDENNESIVKTEEALDEDENDESLVNTKGALDEDENNESFVNTKEALSDDENNKSIVNTKEALDEDENNESIVNTKEALDVDENNESIVNTKEALDEDENNEIIVNSKEALDADENSIVKTEEALDEEENDESLVNTKEALDDDENDESLVKTKEALDEDENIESFVNTKGAFDEDVNDESLVNTKEALDEDEILVNTEEALDDNENDERTVNTKEALDDDENVESLVNIEKALDEDENNESIVNTKEALDEDENDESIVNTKEALDDDEKKESLGNTKEALDDDENVESLVNIEKALDEDENNESIVNTKEALDEDENNEITVNSKEALDEDENDESLVNTKEALDEDENNEIIVNSKEALDADENSIVKTEEALDEEENDESLVNTKEALDDDENDESLVKTKEALDEDENIESFVNTKGAFDEDVNDESLVNTKEALDEDEILVNTEEALDDNENDERTVNTKEALDDDENVESLVNIEKALDEDENNESIVNTKEALDEDENDESIVNTKEALDDDEKKESLGNTKEALDDDENVESLVNIEKALDEDENNESIVNTKEALDEDENNEITVNSKEALDEDENDESLVNTKEALDDDENDESLVKTKEALDEDENIESLVNTKGAFDEDVNDESLVNTKEALDDNENDERTVNTKEALNDYEINESIVNTEEALDDDENDESIVKTKEALDEDENIESLVNTKEAFDEDVNDESLVNTKEALDEDENNESLVNTKEALDDDENDESLVKTREALDEDENIESLVNTKEAFDEDVNDESLVNTKEALDDDESLVNTEEALDDNENDERTVNTKEALDDDENNESLGNTKKAVDDDENDESIVNTKEALNDDENNESLVNTKEALDDDENIESIVNTEEALNDDENDESIVNTEDALDEDEKDESLVNTKEALDEDENDESLVNTKEALDEDENDESLVNTKEALGEDEKDESSIQEKNLKPGEFCSEDEADVSKKFTNNTIKDQIESEDSMDDLSFSDDKQVKDVNDETQFKVMDNQEDAENVMNVVENHELDVSCRNNSVETLSNLTFQVEYHREKQDGYNENKQVDDGESNNGVEIEEFSLQLDVTKSDDISGDSDQDENKIDQATTDSFNEENGEMSDQDKNKMDQATTDSFNKENGEMSDQDKNKMDQARIDSFNKEKGKMVDDDDVDGTCIEPAVDQENRPSDCTVSKTNSFHTSEDYIGLNVDVKFKEGVDNEGRLSEVKGDDSDEKQNINCKNVNGVQDLQNDNVDRASQETTNTEDMNEWCLYLDTEDEEIAKSQDDVEKDGNNFNDNEEVLNEKEKILKSFIADNIDETHSPCTEGEDNKHLKEIENVKEFGSDNVRVLNNEKDNSLEEFRQDQIDEAQLEYGREECSKHLDGTEMIKDTGNDIVEQTKHRCEKETAEKLISTDDLTSKLDVDINEQGITDNETGNDQSSNKAIVDASKVEEIDNIRLDDKAMVNRQNVDDDTHREEMPVKLALDADGQLCTAKELTSDNENSIIAQDTVVKETDDHILRDMELTSDNENSIIAQDTDDHILRAKELTSDNENSIIAQDTVVKETDDHILRAKELTSDNENSIIAQDTDDHILRAKELASDNENSMIAQDTVVKETDDHILRAKELTSDNENSIIAQDTDDHILRAKELTSDNENSIIAQDTVVKETDDHILRAKEITSDNENSIIAQDTVVKERDDHILRAKELTSDNENSIIAQDTVVKETDDHILRAKELASDNENSIISQDTDDHFQLCTDKELPPADNGKCYENVDTTSHVEEGIDSSDTDGEDIAMSGVVALSQISQDVDGEDIVLSGIETLSQKSRDSTGESVETEPYIPNLSPQKTSGKISMKSEEINHEIDVTEINSSELSVLEQNVMPQLSPKVNTSDEPEEHTKSETEKVDDLTEIEFSNRDEHQEPEALKNKTHSLQAAVDADEMNISKSPGRITQKVEHGKEFQSSCNIFHGIEQDLVPNSGQLQTTEYPHGISSQPPECLSAKSVLDQEGKSPTETMSVAGDINKSETFSKEVQSKSRKRKLPADFEDPDESTRKRTNVDPGLVQEMVSGFFNIWKSVKGKIFERKNLKKNLLKRIVKHFFRNYNVKDQEDSIKSIIDSPRKAIQYENNETQVALDLLSKKSIKYLVVDDFNKSPKVNVLHNGFNRNDATNKTRNQPADDVGSIAFETETLTSMQMSPIVEAHECILEVKELNMDDNIVSDNVQKGMPFKKLLETAKESYIFEKLQTTVEENKLILRSDSPEYERLDSPDYAPSNTPEYERSDSPEYELVIFGSEPQINDEISASDPMAKKLPQNKPEQNGSLLGPARETTVADCKDGSTGQLFTNTIEFHPPSQERDVSKETSNIDTGEFVAEDKSLQPSISEEPCGTKNMDTQKTNGNDVKFFESSKLAEDTFEKVYGPLDAGASSEEERLCIDEDSIQTVGSVDSDDTSKQLIHSQLETDKTVMNKYKPDENNGNIACKDDDDTEDSNFKIGQIVHTKSDNEMTNQELIEKTDQVSSESEMKDVGHKFENSKHDEKGLPDKNENVLTDDLGEQSDNDGKKSPDNLKENCLDVESKQNLVENGIDTDYELENEGQISGLDKSEGMILLSSDDSTDGKDKVIGKEKVEKMETYFVSRFGKPEVDTDIEKTRNNSELYVEEKRNHSTLTLPDFDSSPETSFFNKSAGGRSSSGDSSKISPCADLCDDDSDSLPQVEFLKASPAKYAISVKHEEPELDSGMESGNENLENQKIKTTPKKDSRRENCASTDDEGHMRVRDKSTTPSKLKLKLKKPETIEESPRKKVLKKRKREVSPKKQTSPQKELKEIDNTPKKRPYRKRGANSKSPGKALSASENEASQEKPIVEIKGIKHSPKIKPGNKRVKMEKVENRRLSDLIEIITDSESDVEMEKPAILKTEKIEFGEDMRNKPSLEILTAESSVTEDGKSETTLEKLLPVESLSNVKNNTETLMTENCENVNQRSELGLEVLKSNESSTTNDEKREPNLSMPTSEEKSESSVEILTAESSVTDKDDSPVESIIQNEAQEQVKRKEEVGSSQTSISDVDNVHSDDSVDKIFSQQSAVTLEQDDDSVDKIFSQQSAVTLGHDDDSMDKDQCLSQQSTATLISDENNVDKDCSSQETSVTVVGGEPSSEGSELSVCYSNTVIPDSVTEDDNSICLEYLPALNNPTLTVAEFVAASKLTSGENLQGLKTNNDKSLKECTFEDTATDDEEGLEIDNIVNFLENETVCYGNILEDQKSVSGESCTRESDDGELDMSHEDGELTQKISTDFDQMEQVVRETDQDLPDFSHDIDNVLTNLQGTSTPNDAERESLIRLQNIQRELDLKATRKQMSLENSNVFTPKLNTDETFLYTEKNLTGRHDDSYLKTPSKGTVDDNTRKRILANVPDVLSDVNDKCHNQSPEYNHENDNDDISGLGNQENFDVQNEQLSDEQENECFSAYHDLQDDILPLQSEERQLEGIHQVYNDHQNEDGIEALAKYEAVPLQSADGDENDHYDDGTPLSLHFSHNNSLSMDVNNAEEIDTELMDQNYFENDEEDEDEEMHTVDDANIRSDNFVEQEADNGENLCMDAAQGYPSTSCGFIKPEKLSQQEPMYNPVQTSNEDIDTLYERENSTLQQDVKVERDSASSPEEVISKRKAKELLEKLKAKKRKLEIPRDVVREGEPGPSGSRVPNQSSDLEMCRELIVKLMTTLSKEKDKKNHHRVEAWKKELKDLEHKLSVPKFTVAVVGTTGAGKSSLMNAIIDQYNVLPTSGTQACTAVVVKIDSNDKSDQFEADIEFLSKEEWEHECQLLIKDLTNKDGKMKKAKPDPETDTGVAFLKMRAVYGKFDSLETLQKTTIVTRHLGKTQTIKSRSPQDFRNKINQYIENTATKTGGQFWPIIKFVTIRIPRCAVCSNGVTLVDLPGVRDANAARDRIAKDYMKNCSVMLVVAEIHRACSSKTAKDLLGENFRRQLLMDGQYTNVAFVCTKNDVITPSELIRELKLTKETDAIEKALKAMTQTIDRLTTEEKKLHKEVKTMTGEISVMSDDMEELDRDIKAIEQLVETSDEDEELKELRSDLERKSCKLLQKKQNLDAKHRNLSSIASQKNQLEIEMIDKRKTINLICAKARTEFAQNQIKRDYKAGIKEMKRKANMTQEEIDEDEEEDYESEEEDSGSELSNSCENIKVFCVSSSEYQKLKNRLTDDGPPVVFDSEDDTGIPAVRQFVHHIVQEKREEATKRLIKNLAVFVYDIQNYLTENGIICKDERISAQLAVENVKSRLMVEFDPILDKILEDVTKQVESKIATQLKKGVEVAVNSAVDTCSHWGSPVDQDNKRNGGLCFPTYQATVRRYGEYQSKASGDINFNEDLAKPLTTSISIVWCNFFSYELWTLLETYKVRILQSLKRFTDKLCAELKSISVSQTQLETTRRQLYVNANNKLTEMIRNLKEFVEVKQRDINRLFSPTVQENLNDTYKDCMNDKGQGIFKRMKQKLQTGVDTGRRTMFDEASNTLLRQLDDLMKEVIEEIRKVCQTLCDSLQVAFEPLWNSCEASKQLKSTLFEDITGISVDVSGLCTRLGVQITRPTHTDSPLNQPRLHSLSVHSESIVSQSSSPEPLLPSLPVTRALELQSCTMASSPALGRQPTISIAETGVCSSAVTNSQQPISSHILSARGNRIIMNERDTRLIHGNESLNFLMKTDISRLQKDSSAAHEPRTSVMKENQNGSQSSGSQIMSKKSHTVDVKQGRHGKIVYKKQEHGNSQGVQSSNSRHRSVRGKSPVDRQFKEKIGLSQSQGNLRVATYSTPRVGQLETERTPSPHQTISLSASKGVKLSQGHSQKQSNNMSQRIYNITAPNQNTGVLGLKMCAPSTCTVSSSTHIVPSTTQDHGKQKSAPIAPFSSTSVNAKAPGEKLYQTFVVKMPAEIKSNLPTDNGSNMKSNSQTTGQATSLRSVTSTSLSSSPTFGSKRLATNVSRFAPVNSSKYQASQSIGRQHVPFVSTTTPTWCVPISTCTPTYQSTHSNQRTSTVVTSSCIPAATCTQSGQTFVRSMRKDVPFSTTTASNQHQFVSASTNTSMQKKETKYVSILPNTKTSTQVSYSSSGAMLTRNPCQVSRTNSSGVTHVRQTPSPSNISSTGHHITQQASFLPRHQSTSNTNPVRIDPLLMSQKHQNFSPYVSKEKQNLSLQGSQSNISRLPEQISNMQQSQSFGSNFSTHRSKMCPSINKAPQRTTGLKLHHPYDSLHQQVINQDISELKKSLWNPRKRTYDQSHAMTDQGGSSSDTTSATETPVEIKTEPSDNPSYPKRRRGRRENMVVIMISDSESD